MLRLKDPRDRLDYLSLQVTTKPNLLSDITKPNKI